MEGAQRYAEKSVQLTSGGNAYDWMLLALSARQEGDLEKANTWYRQAACLCCDRGAYRDLSGMSASRDPAPGRLGSSGVGRTR